MKVKRTLFCCFLQWLQVFPQYQKIVLFQSKNLEKVNIPRGRGEKETAVSIRTNWERGTNCRLAENSILVHRISCAITAGLWGRSSRAHLMGLARGHQMQAVANLSFKWDLLLSKYAKNQARPYCGIEWETLGEHSFYALHLKYALKTALPPRNINSTILNWLQLAKSIEDSGLKMMGLCLQLHC